MRNATTFTALLILTALTCAPAAAPRPGPFTGSWSGQASITVPWTARRTLDIHLQVNELGGVTGTIGNARLIDAQLFADNRFARSLRLGREYALEGALEGALIRSEGIARDRVRLSLDLVDSTLAGDLVTSGSYDGDSSTLKLTAAGLTLYRAPRAIALRTLRRVPGAGTLRAPGGTAP